MFGQATCATATDGRKVVIGPGRVSARAFGSPPGPSQLVMQTRYGREDCGSGTKHVEEYEAVDRDLDVKPPASEFEHHGPISKPPFAEPETFPFGPNGPRNV